MNKYIALIAAGAASLCLMGFLPESPESSADDDPPPKKKGDPAKKKEEEGPAGELKKAYDLLRRVKSDDGVGRGDDRLRDWSERATRFYRKGVDAYAAGQRREAAEYGVAAHDLARAVDHARNAMRLDQPDADLPRPPDSPGPEGDGPRTRRDLRHAYDRIREVDADAPDAKFYKEAARDLYNAALRDAQAGRIDRGGELARAAEALTHVPEHLDHAASPPLDDPEKKARDEEKKARDEEKKARDEEKKARDEKKKARDDEKKARDDEKKKAREADDESLPPPLD